MSTATPGSAALRRTAVTVALPVAAALSIAWTATMPPFPDGYAERLAAIADAGSTGTASAVLFVISQLFMLVAFLGIGRMALRRAPRLATVGSALGVIGCLGHAVWGGASLLTLQMAADVENRAVHARVLEAFESSPLMLFAAAGLLGTVLGFLLLGIALLRSRVVPRWVPTLLLAFLVLEFVGTSLSEWAGHGAGVCLGVAFGALAVGAWRSPDSEWALAPTEDVAPRHGAENERREGVVPA